MLQLGDVSIREVVVVSVAWRGDRLRLVLRWELAELPVLLDLAEEVRLSWWSEDDAECEEKESRKHVASGPPC